MHFIHTWSPWKQMVRKSVMVHKPSGREYPYTENFQQRECLVCGKVQKDEDF